MDSKDWLELAKLSQESFKNRRELEWKLSFGFWTAIGAITLSTLTVDGFSCPPLMANTLGLAYLLLLAISFSCWHMPLQYAHTKDKEFYKYYTRKAEGLECKRPETKWTEWSSNSKAWFWGQILYTIIFLSLSWLVITQIAPTIAERRTNLPETRKKV